MLKFSVENGHLWSSSWKRWFSVHQALLLRTAEKIQAEQNSCPVLQPVFDFAD